MKVKAPHESYTCIKKERCDIGVTAENRATKGIADRMPKSAQIAVDACANRTRARIGISIETGSYLALNWQCGQIERQLTCRDRRFPTPLQRRSSNERETGGEHALGTVDVTTTHLFRPNQRRRATSLLPIWIRNSNILVHSYDQKPDRGEGVRSTQPPKMPRSISSHGILCPKDSPTLLGGLKKTPGSATATPDVGQLTACREFACDD
jgi:hypothetical protein